MSKEIEMDIRDEIKNIIETSGPLSKGAIRSKLSDQSIPQDKLVKLLWDMVSNNDLEALNGQNGQVFDFPSED